MMNKYLYPTLVVSLFSVLGIVYNRYETKKAAIPVLKERKQNITTTSEWLNTKAAVETLLDKIRRNPNDLKSKLALGMAYVQESRVTGDHAYYDEAALKLADQVLEKEPVNYEALCLKTTILLSQHHFADALKAAKDLTINFPTAAYGYGLLCDAEVETGNYNEAVAAADKMNAMRPDLRSYSRISYLREILGDYTGAKQAMEMAIKSGIPGMEQTEWCRTQLAQLYEKTNDFLKADTLYQLSLAARPNYTYALIGEARIKMHDKKFDDAINLLNEAKTTSQDFLSDEELVKTYRQAADYYQQSDPAKSKLMADNLKNASDKLIAAMKIHATDDKVTPDKGHYADKELAYAYLEINDTDNALIHATREWNRRPENIDVNECLAWVYFKRGDIANAKTYIQKAQRTGSKNPLLLERSRVIMTSK